MYIASINLRIHVASDLENAWPNRRDAIIKFIRQERFDIIGCQEASNDMVNDLMKGLSDEYHVIFQTRDDRGEGVPILYLKTHEKIEDKTYWLSNTPEKLSMVDGSHFPRIVTMVRFNQLVFFNTHLDYASDDVCLEQAKYLLQVIEKETKQEDKVIITGDFNVHPDSKTITFMTQYLHHIFQSEDDNQLTYHGFSEKTEGKPIDYIFYSNDIDVSESTIHHHTTQPFLSDHYPISARINFKQ